MFTGITALHQRFSYVQSENQKPENNLRFTYTFLRTQNITQTSCFLLLYHQCLKLYLVRNKTTLQKVFPFSLYSQVLTLEQFC